MLEYGRHVGTGLVKPVTAGGLTRPERMCGTAATSPGEHRLMFVPTIRSLRPGFKPR